METALGYVQDFWGLLLVMAAFIIYLVSQGRAKAGKILLSLMLRLEKQAEEYALQTGEEKFRFVVERGYQLLPKYIKMFITYKMFVELAYELYEEAKSCLMSLDKKSIPVQIKNHKEIDHG